ncbi:MAG: hybrid sensor histidine kinase/response regulator [Moorea sp. SIO2B7]|nr:hybrid sensor histidine kinase/response regulator [Moorena sp. SIO2B7]
MSEDNRDKVRLQFLDEAQENLDKIESGLLGLGAGSVDSQTLDGVLRAAHSIKGGAAMMGFDSLSHLAHRLEDFFKVLKAGRSGVVDGETERLLLSSVDRLSQIIVLNRQGATVKEAWLESDVNPIIEQLHDRLGDPQPEDEAALLSAEFGEDMSVFLFETEVEGCLQRLEEVLANPEQPCLREEIMIAAQQLGGLGEILDLSAFRSLCESIYQSMEAASGQEKAIASLAIEQWRRSQALVFANQIALLPAQLDLSTLGAAEVNASPREQLDTASLPETFPEIESFDDAVLPMESIESFMEIDNALSMLSNLENLPSPEQETVTEADVEEKVPSTSPVIPILETTSAPPTPTPTPPSPGKSTPKSEPVAAPSTSRTSQKTIRVPVRQLEQLTDMFGELIIERNGLDLQLKSLRNLIGLLREKVKVLEQSNFQLRTEYDKVTIQSTSNSVASVATAALGSNNQFIISNEQKFDVLEMDHYSDLHLLSGEVMETIVQIQEVISDLEIHLGDTERNARQLKRTSKVMQSSLTQVRMRPFSDLLARFPRALRDMALQYGKQVELKVKGGSTLVDRTILEALNDPLLHLFRNAFDHGIEDPATRKAKGKPEKGLIEINAAYRGNQTVITISDDGGGIELDKIKAKGLKMGLNEADLVQASESDLLDLIFEPGFSTAEKVTDLSGRGVGMDVVRTNLEDIKGEIQVETKLGLGTTFTIKVPLTLSVVRVLLVENRGMLLAFPTNAVEEMLLLQPEMVIMNVGKEVLNWEGYMVPLIRLSPWLNFPRPPQMAGTETVPIINQPTVLMIAKGDDLVGIQMDRYWGEQEVTIRQVEGSIKMPPGFTGCTILGDGRVVPLIDALGLLRWIDNNGSTQSLKPSLDFLPAGGVESLLAEIDGGAPSSQLPKQKNSIMVVDDSINVRRFLALTLEKAGYRVEQAKDGQEALEKLQGGLFVQAVICDIEMPRLDGYGFLANVKSDPNFKLLPVFMLTSRSGPKHRKMAMNLGATGYFSKPFKEQELLQTLKDWINN